MMYSIKGSDIIIIVYEFIELYVPFQLINKFQLEHNS